MSGPGPSPFQQANDDSAPPPPRMLRRLPVSQSPTWAVTMLFCCLVIGLLAAWIRAELGVMHFERSRINVLGAETSLAEGREEDLGKLMSDPRTQIIQLSGPNNSQAQHACVAWNESLRSGVLFCDSLVPLSAGLHYVITTQSRGQSSHPTARIDARPGMSVYPFQFQQSDPVSQVSRFDIRDDSTPTQTPILSGDVH